MSPPASLTRDISPPPTRKASTPGRQPLDRCTSNGAAVANDDGEKKQAQVRLLDTEPSLAAIEAGQDRIRDHLSYFAQHFSTLLRPSPGPRLSLVDFRSLYTRNQHPHGHHFVIHQHDHPISGVHYDLRLQFSETSTVSWAVPYGLPGNPNSVRPNRIAVETRVHCLWNNLIESASHATGSLLIWDTGEYEVLDRPMHKRARLTDDESSDVEEGSTNTMQSQSERLVAAFQSRHIHLRLQGQRLPPNYTIALRLPSQDAAKQPRKPRIKRRRQGPAKAVERRREKAASTDTGSDPEAPDKPPTGTASISTADVEADDKAALASEDNEGEDAAIRAHNAYPGASNRIGSIHQRHWFLTLDRPRSGFRKARSGPEEGRWVGPWEGFYVRGREHERSLVTRRLADEVMGDEGVERFMGRGGWRPILE